MSEWKQYLIGELGKVVTGTTPSSKYPEDFGTEIPFVTPTDYKTYNKWILSAERSLSKNGLSKLESRVLPPNSVLVTCIGSDMGKVALNRIPVISNQQINSIIPTQVVNSNFLYYKLVESYDLLRMYGEAGTAVPIVNKGDFENIVLDMPENVAEQVAIAEVLSSLDDKIDLLHRQNKTLEQLAETLFRQWFVEEAEELVPLGDVVKTTSGGTPSRSNMQFYQGGSIDWVKSKELNGGYIFETEEQITSKALQSSSAKILPANSVLIAMYGATVGEYAILANEGSCNQAICALIPSPEYPYTFLFMLVKHNKENLVSMAIGSAQQNISQELIKELEIPSNIEVIHKFHNCVDVMFDKIKSNSVQIGALEKLRNTLLPKLMAGNVRVEKLG